MFVPIDSASLQTQVYACSCTHLRRHSHLAICYINMQDCFTDSLRQMGAALTVLGAVSAEQAADNKPHRLRADISLFDHPKCTGDHIRKPFHIKEGECHNADDFMSLKAVPYEPQKYGSNFAERKCAVWYYADKGCTGKSSTYDMANAGNCLDTTFPPGGAPAQGRSVRLHCGTELCPPKSKPINSVHTFTYTSTDPPLKTTTMTETVTSVPIPSSSEPMATTTVTALSTLITQVSSSPTIVTVPSVTTILATPVATSTGTETVWVPYTSGSTTLHHLSTMTSVITIDARPNKAMATAGAQRRAVEIADDKDDEE